MHQIGFDNDKYLRLQSQHIRERIDRFGGKLYLEFGGKLYDDNHASRVLPGFQPDSKMKMLLELKDEAEVVIVINAGDIEKNFSTYYVDVKLWMREKGYADIIIPQVYYGFEHEKMPFEKTAGKWLESERAEGVDMLCGLAAYKQGVADELAGSGSNEWINSSDVIERQKKYADNSLYSGYVLFSYNNIII